MTLQENQWNEFNNQFEIVYNMYDFPQQKLESIIRIFATIDTFS